MWRLEGSEKRARMSLVTMSSSGFGKSISRESLFDCCTFVSFIQVSFGGVILGIRDMVQRRCSRAHDGKSLRGSSFWLLLLLQYVRLCSDGREWRVGDSPRGFRKVVKVLLLVRCRRNLAFYMPPKPPTPPCLPAASPCIFSETLMLTSKNLPTQRSRQTDSPLLRSPSR
jgi:hypothetical protein